MPGSSRRKATIAQTSSSRCWVGQAGMPVKRTPCLTMRKSWASRPFADLAGEIRRLRQHQMHGGRARFAGRAMADGAAAREMAGGRLDGVARQLVRHLDGERVGSHGRAHGEMQEPFGDLPVAGRGADIEEADPGRKTAPRPAGSPRPIARCFQLTCISRPTSRFCRPGAAQAGRRRRRGRRLRRSSA